MMSAIGRDLRFAARGLRRNPGFTAAAVLTLALGIGATTAVFSVVYGVLMRPLPFPNADRLVQIVQVLEPTPQSPEPVRAGLTSNQFADLQEQNRTLAAVGGYSPAPRTLYGIDVPMRLSGAGVTPDLFSGLGVAPALGRLFVPEDAARGAERVVILNYRTWVRYFGRDAAIIGRPILLGVDYRVVGVMPEGFGFPSLARESMARNSAGEVEDAPEFWFPLSSYQRLPEGIGGFTTFTAFAMLRDGVTPEQALADIRSLASPLPRGRRATFEIVSAADEMAEPIRGVLGTFQLGVTLILLIAAVNVANLLLTRAAHRRRENALRAALGATRGRLVREGVAESILLSLAGGALGCWLAYAAVAVLQSLPPHLLPRLNELRVDLPVLLFGLLLSLGTGLAVGLLSAVRVGRSGTLSPLSPALRGVTFSPHRRLRPSGVLVVVEIAATMVLLTGSALLIASFARLMQVDPGYATEGTLTFSIPLTGSRYERAPGAQQDVVQRVLDTARGLPGVVDVAAINVGIEAGPIGFGAFAVNGQPVEGDVRFRVVTPGYFRTLDVPLRLGREFTDADRRPVAATAVVNEAFAKRYLAGSNPLGANMAYREWTSLQIVGVVADTRIRLDEESGPALYLPPDARSPFFTPSIIIRSTAEPSAIIPAVRQIVRRIDPQLAVYNAMTIEEMIAHTSASPRLYGLLSLWCAVIALALAATGLYGVLAYSVGTRTQEFGIRMALGADARHVYANVMRQGLLLTVAGLAVGLAGSYYASRFLESLLFGLTPHDPATFTAAVMTFVAVAALACFIPARRATRVDPVVALRAE